jgi:hypothetical protein
MKPAKVFFCSVMSIEPRSSPIRSAIVSLPPSAPFAAHYSVARRSVKRRVDALRHVVAPRQPVGRRRRVAETETR